jgi:hypothetical protein
MVHKILLLLLSSNGAILCFPVCSRHKATDPAFMSGHYMLHEAITFCFSTMQKFLTGIDMSFLRFRSQPSGHLPCGHSVLKLHFLPVLCLSRLHANNMYKHLNFKCSPLSLGVALSVVASSIYAPSSSDPVGLIAVGK